MPDHMRDKWHGGEKPDTADQLQWLEDQRQFLAKRARPETKKQVKRRAKAKAGPAKTQKDRVRAYHMIRALDHAFVEGTEGGLNNYKRDATGCELSLSNRPLICLQFDECSSSLAMYLYLAYKAHLRVVVLRDIYHREWNDVKLGLQWADVWWVVVLTTLAINLPHGPWGGSAWFHQMVEAMKDMVQRSPHGSPLFDEYDSAICRDRGADPSGGVQAKIERLEALPETSGFKAKGEKCALRRWFAWPSAAQFLDTCWHSRCLAIMYIGVNLGVYTAHRDSPMNAEGTVETKRPSQEAEADGAEGDGQAEAADVVAAAQSVSMPSEPAPGVPEDKQVKNSKQEIADLRKKCKNTLFVVACILQRPGLQLLTRLICLIVKPIHDHHSFNASDVREVPNVSSYYLRMSRKEFIKPVITFWKSLQDTVELGRCGFSTTLAHLKKC